ncbi:hypothetical protein [Paenibacillus daejeonensis]|uniref:hypothetical protein n=1 Tax=Paenibacillus daejeonensis TaxID=135193 RepID=UPI00037C9A17|nr:hypothetical protein [Paenibacillus daejeonensis]
MEKALGFEAKKLSAWPEVLYLSLLLFMLGRLVWGGTSGWSMVVAATLMGFIAVVLAEAIRYLPQPRNHPLIIHEKYIIAGDIMYYPNEIGHIVIRGYFRPQLRIKSPGRERLRRREWFRITKDEDQGLRELRAWAKRHGVKVG